LLHLPDRDKSIPEGIFSGRLWLNHGWLRRIVNDKKGPSDFKGALDCLLKSFDGELTLQEFTERHDCSCLLGARVNTMKSDVFWITFQAGYPVNGRRRGFVLTASPIKYGSGVVRSYLADETGIIHATSDDRPANMGDPQADPGEFTEPASIE
jgi:hypothetical protein